MSAEERALIVFDHIYYAMRGEHVLREAGLKIKTVAPPPEFRTGCDLAIEISARDVDRAERILDEKGVLILDVLFIPRDARLRPLFLTKLIKTTDFGKWMMVRCGNMKITYEKDTGRIVNISGGGCPDIPYLGIKIVGTVLGEGPRPRAVGSTICAYTLEQAYKKALELFKKKR